jgi:multiple sugar transport system permease protein
MIYLFVFLAPLLYAVWDSLHRSSYFEVGAFSGLASFSALLADRHFPGQVVTTLTFAIGTIVIALPAGLASALLVDKIGHVKRLARAILLLPWLMSQATVGIIWLWFLNPSYGPATYVSTQLGLGRTDVFSSPTGALVAMIVITAWWSYPQAMLLFLGALQTIPPSLVESLRIDGGNEWHLFRYVTLPYIWNTVITVIVVLLMLYVQMVTIILVTTRGGPLTATETLSMAVYNKLFRDFDLSGASATALLLFAFNGLLTIAALRFRRRSLL